MASEGAEGFEPKSKIKYESQEDTNFPVSNEEGLVEWLKDHIMDKVRKPGNPTLEIKTLKKPVEDAIPLADVDERVQTMVSDMQSNEKKLKTHKENLKTKLKPYEDTKKRLIDPATKYLESHKLKSRVFLNKSDPNQNMVMYLDHSVSTKKLSVTKIKECLDEVVAAFFEQHFPDMVGQPFNATTIPAIREKWTELAAAVKQRIDAVYESKELVTESFKFKAKILKEDDHMLKTMLHDITNP